MNFCGARLGKSGYAELPEVHDAVKLQGWLSVRLEAGRRDEIEENRWRHLCQDCRSATVAALARASYVYLPERDAHSQ